MTVANGGFTLRTWRREDSPTRLPVRFADEISRHGESGMGHTIFTVVFADGQRQACVTGNAVDFIRYPLGKGPRDVAAVIPHAGRRDESLVKGTGMVLVPVL
jgi:hypothetical protein